MRLGNQIVSEAESYQSIYTEDEVDVIKLAYYGGEVGDVAGDVVGDTCGEYGDESDDDILCMVSDRGSGSSVLNIGGGTDINVCGGALVNICIRVLNGGTGTLSNVGEGVNSALNMLIQWKRKRMVTQNNTNVLGRSLSFKQ